VEPAEVAACYPLPRLGVVDGGQDVDGAGSVDIDVHGLDHHTATSEQQSASARAGASGYVQNT